MLSRHGDVLLGVLGIDYSLRAISAWLGREFSGVSGATFIVQQESGYMVASSTGEGVTSPTMSPLLHRSPLVRHAARWLEALNWTVPAGRATHQNMTEEFPPTEWLAENSEFVEHINEDSVLRLHVTAQNVVGHAVKNLRWILVSAEVQEETCATAGGSNLMVPDARHLECLCRAEYRPTGASCTYCSEFDPICRAAGAQCISCFGGAAVVARAGFYIEDHSVYTCDRKRCVSHRQSLSPFPVASSPQSDTGIAVAQLGPADHSNGEIDSQSFGTLSPALCGGPGRAATDDLGNCCAPGHYGKLCAFAARTMSGRARAASSAPRQTLPAWRGWLRPSACWSSGSAFPSTIG